MASSPTIARRSPALSRLWTLAASRRASLAAGGALVLVTALAALEFIHFGHQVRTWYLMTDELLWEKLGLSVFQTASPLPSVRGLPVDAYSGLYPLLTALAYARDDMHDALRAVHEINGLLMASAAIPAYLLARAVRASRLAALITAALTVAVPWAVFTLLVMSESVSYPAFLWAMLAMHRAMVRPSVAADAIALAGAVLATYSRTQFVVLAPAFMIAVIAHEMAQARVDEPRASWSQALARPVRRHPLLAAVTLIASAALAVQLQRGHASSMLGGYGAAVEGPLPSWASMLPNIKRVVAWITLDTGVLPVVAGAAWLLTTSLRPRAGRAAHAFALLSLFVIAFVSATVFVFITKFAGGDRYLFYVAPILFLAMLAALTGVGGRIRVVAIALTLALAIWSLGYLTFAPDSRAGVHASPGETAVPVFYWWPRRIASAVGIEHAGHMWAMYAAAAGAALVVFAVSRLQRLRLALGVSLAVLVYGAGLTHYAFGKMLLDHGGPPPPQTIDNRDWVDRAVPKGASVATVPSQFVDWFYSGRVWWDIEFWNRTIDRVYSVNGADTYTALPHDRISVDPDTGRVEPPVQPDYVVLTSEANAFKPRGEVIARSPQPILVDQDVYLELWRVKPPLSAALTVTNLDKLHYFRAGHPARIRVFGGPAPAAVRIDATLQFAQGSPARRGWSIRTGGSVRRGRLQALTTTQVSTELCVPAGGHQDVFLDVAGRPKADAADDGLRLVAVKSSAGARDCAGTGS